MTASLRRTLPVTALAVAALLGTGLAGTANAANTTVTGTVKTALGTPVAGASVSIKVGNKTINATTSATGAFSASGVTTGAATISLGNGSANAELPPVWAINAVSTSIATAAVLNFTLPATSAVSVLVSQVGTPIAGAKISQCTASSPADPAVVLAGSAAVAPTQDFTGATTSAAGDVVIRSFKDATLGRLCAAFTASDLGATTKYVVRSGMIDATADTSKKVYVPAVTEQAGTVKDSTNTGKDGVKVAIRSAGGQIDSTSPVTTATGAFTTQVAAGNVFARISSRSLKGAVAPPTNIPRAFKATFDATAGTPWSVNLPATVDLTVKVVNPDGSPVSGAVIRPAAGSSYGAANSATLVAGAGTAAITQQVYGDTFSTALGLTTARLFPDSNLAAFQIVKNVGGGLKRTVEVPAGTNLSSSTQITVTLPKL